MRNVYFKQYFTHHLTCHFKHHFTLHFTHHFTCHFTHHFTSSHASDIIFGLNHVSVTTPSLPSESIYPLLKSPHFAKDLCLLNYEIDGENPVHGNEKKNHFRV